MLVLFDQGTPGGIAGSLEGHIVIEARAMGWDTLSNGDLLYAAEVNGFDVLLTSYSVLDAYSVIQVTRNSYTHRF